MNIGKTIYSLKITLNIKLMKYIKSQAINNINYRSNLKIKKIGVK